MANNNIDAIKAQILINQKTIDDLNATLKKEEEKVAQQQRETAERKLLSDTLASIDKITNPDHLHTLSVHISARLVKELNDQIAALKKSSC